MTNPISELLASWWIWVIWLVKDIVENFTLFFTHGEEQCVIRWCYIILIISISMFFRSSLRKKEEHDNQYIRCNFNLNAWCRDLLLFFNLLSWLLAHELEEDSWWCFLAFLHKSWIKLNLILRQSLWYNKWFKIGQWTFSFTFADVVILLSDKFIVEKRCADIFLFTLALHLIFKMRNDAPINKLTNVSRVAFENTSISLYHTEGITVGLWETEVSKTELCNDAVTIFVIKVITSELVDQWNMQDRQHKE